MISLFVDFLEVFINFPVPRVWNGNKKDNNWQQFTPIENNYNYYNYNYNQNNNHNNKNCYY